MGWTGTYVNHKITSVQDKKDLIIEELECEYLEVLKATIVGNACYSVIKDKTKGIIFGVVSLFSLDRDGCFWTKHIDESMGPGYYDMPVSMLNMLSDTEDEYALEWRKGVRENAEEKSRKRKDPNSLSNLPIGSKIQFRLNDEQYVLTKYPPGYQFKRNFWMCEEKRLYMKRKDIPSDYEVLRVGF